MLSAFGAEAKNFVYYRNSCRPPPGKISAESEKLWDMGFSQQAAGDFKACAETFKKLFAEEKDFKASAEFNYGSCLGKLADFAGAESALRLASKLEPSMNALVQHQLTILTTDKAMVLMDQGHGDEAEGLVKKVIKDNPKSTLALSEMAFIYQRESKFKDCVDVSTKALKIDSGFLQARVNRGGCNIGLGKDQEALKDFDEVVSKQPTFEAFVMRAQIYARSGKCDKAQADANSAVAQNPEAKAYFAANKYCTFKFAD
jgi:tetratricopeptide (TPR) repeat protein